MVKLILHEYEYGYSEVLGSKFCTGLDITYTYPLLNVYLTYGPSGFSTVGNHN
jgi:hypothetical protein